jgi:ferrochelatase
LTGTSIFSALATLKRNAPAGTGKIGVLLVNVGTPDSPSYWSVRRYLREFLSDPRVVEVPRLLWRLILNLAILPFRPLRRSMDYSQIWNWQFDEAPLKRITRLQAEKLNAWIIAGGLEIEGHPPQSSKILIAWGMRYGKPALGDGVRTLKDHGCTRILVVPLYPQYSAATTASACDKVFETLRTMRAQPAIRIAPPYYNDPTYIDVLATSVRARLAKLDFVPEAILVSFHGMPRAYIDKGDPYLEQCRETWRLLRESLQLTAEQCPISFQSRFGGGPWLEPYTDETVKSLAKRGVTRLVVVTPGFAADCLETLHELGVEVRELFERNGGKKFALVPCLNDSELGMLLIFEHVARELKGWA